MLLVADVGNTDTVFGLFAKPEGAPRVWRAESNPRRTADEWAALLGRLLQEEGTKLTDVEDMVIGSVVPEVTRSLTWFAGKHLGQPPLVITGESDVGMPVDVDVPAQVGPDRIVNCVGALAKWKPPLVVVDLGTATTFDVVNKKGAFVGGMIVPGPSTLLASLAARTARLPQVPLVRTNTVIGKNTAEAMQSGAFWGYVDLVEGLLARIARELGTKPTVVATGGHSKVMGPACRAIDHTDPDLTLDGLRLCWRRHAKARATTRPAARSRK